MPVSKSQQKAVHKYVKANYDRMELTVPKGQRGTIKAHAAARGESVNGFIGRAIVEAMERDGGTAPQEAAGAAQGTGSVFLPLDALETAQGAAERTGEGPTAFIARAIDTQAKRDNSSLRLGIHPITGEKLKQNNDGGGNNELP